MLLELRIRNFAIIEQAELEFSPGLNVLSGETGAGKTIIMNALGLLLGARASPEVIRVGRKEAVVEALFELEDAKLAPQLAEALAVDQARELLVRRTIGEGGRSRALINESLATVQSLGRIGSNLVQVYGQHEQQSLLRVDSHLSILDGYAGLGDELEQYLKVYRQACELGQRLDELNRREHERENLLELARFQVMELKRAGLKPGEDDELSATRAILANSAKLAAAVEEAQELLYGVDGAAIDVIARAANRLGEAAAIDPKLKDALELLESARATVQEAAHGLRAYGGSIEADPARLEQIDARIQELIRIKRKYGGSLASAVEALRRAQAEVISLESMHERKAETETELGAALQDAARRAQELSRLRLSAAEELKRRMETELKTLGMRHAVFEARLARLAAGQGALAAGPLSLGVSGIDAVEFYISPNLGQPPIALARFASGGELSRVMLALKRLEAQRRGVATLIFDEVDAGIGGPVAQVVGRKLKELSRFHQVLCVTHLPQIAAFADQHFVVEKEERRGGTLSRVSQLDKDSRVDELARMLGGTEISDKFRRAARELLDSARA